MPPAAANVTIDLDNLWSYLKTQGVPGWQEYPGYLPLVVPRILDRLKQHAIKATFFIVGRDATRTENAAPLKAISDQGHEIACHSFDHEPCLHLYDRAELDAEFDQAEEAIHKVTGQRPRGFRGPGFSCSPNVLECLRSRGYAYDSSSFPTFLGPLARLYFKSRADLTKDDLERRSGLYGGIRQGFATLRPHAGPSGLMEFPVTTLPLARVPVHQTYLLFLASRSPTLARLYWNLAVTLFGITSLPPTLLLHPTDFLDVTEVPQMAFFPGMSVSTDQKLALVDHVLTSVTRRWECRTLLEQSRELSPVSEPSDSPCLSSTPEPTPP
jgi:peptidoglycan/xylan/chitin deacetylase (PgdA/CDA1 family)